MIVGVFDFRGRPMAFDYVWQDNDTFVFQFGDGEFTDRDGNDYFLHLEYHVADNEWVTEVFWQDEAHVIGFPGSDEYITRDEVEQVKKFIDREKMIDMNHRPETKRTPVPDEQEVRVKVNGGEFIARPSEDPDNPGVYVAYMTEEGNWTDLFLAKADNETKDISLCVWADPYQDDYTDEHEIAHDDIRIAAGEIEPKEDEEESEER